MAYYVSGTTTTANDLITAIKTLAEANGWTIDNYTTGTYNRLHLHKGAQHVDMQATSATAFTLYGCTSYASGSAYNAQPGSSASKAYTIIASTNYYIVSVAGGLYIVIAGAAYVQPLGFATIQDKVGNWNDGAVMIAPYSSGYILSWSTFLSQVYLNGAWSPTSGAGSLRGNGAETLFVNAQPNRYNATIVPVPVMMFVGLSTDSTKHQPIGCIPGLYRCSGGDVYSPGDIITIGSDDYLIVNGLTSGMAGTYGDYLFKLGA